ncbi:exocyst complex component 4 [Parasteatoda tepidariorum]|uniref:exocyst complex component 4 n=1 Tax=Parasteatoda tepidariorum TaxID=114398 RepID=UPI00077FD505|nr:exocyst complex component 4 [Parasteatoda tepidariorum]
MSKAEYRPPVRPPRGGKVSKDTSGRLMNIIAELSVSKSNEDRKHRMQLLKKDFELSDARLVKLISAQREQLNTTMELFSRISAKINNSRRGCRNVKEKLLACKSLLECKRDEIKKLSESSIEHREVLSMLKQIEELNKVHEKVEEHLKQGRFEEATQLLVSSIALLNGKLSAADALKDLKADLIQMKKTLHNVLVKELHKHLYMSPAEVFCTKSIDESTKSKSYEELFSNRSQIKLPIEGQYQDFSADSNYKHISLVLKCSSELNTLPETVEILKDKCSMELLLIIKNTSKLMHETLENSPFPSKTALVYSESHNKEQQQCLHDLVELILEEFRYVAINHYYFLDNVQRIAMTKGLTDLSLTQYEMADIYSKLQTAVEILIGNYLDLHSASTTQRSTAAFSKVPATADISSYFLRKGMTRAKKHALFRFDSSSHAINKKTYLQEQKDLNQKGELDSDDLPVLICEPNAQNITVVYRPIKKFISEIENVLRMDNTTHCPLHSFLDDCVRVFLDDVNININRLVEKISNGIDNWEAMTDIDELKSANAKTHILSSTLLLNSNIKELALLINLLPDYASHFLKLICNLLETYKDLMNVAYKSLISTESDNQHLFSVSWARDPDITRLLQSLPNWKNLKFDHDAEETQFEESPEEIRLRNKEESELLNRNLSCKECISPAEIISDHNKLKNLAFLHESMEWFTFQILQFSDTLPDMQASVAFLPDKMNGEGDATLDLALSMTTKGCLKNLAKEFEDLADTCLLVLHLEVRAHCFFHLMQPSKLGSYITRKDDEEPEPQVVKLNQDLSKIDESLSPVLQTKKMKYIFEGIGELLSTILIKRVSNNNKIKENDIKKMGRNIFAIQQNLAGITMTREVALDRARQFYDLLNHTCEEILNQIVEEGPQFQEHEYTVVIKLLCNSREMHGEQNSLNDYLEKLRQILDEVAVSV